MSIELRLAETNLSTPDNIIYRDIGNLPDALTTTTLGITIHYYNHDDSSLYFQIVGSGEGYTFTPTNLGLLAGGSNAYACIDAFATRSKPSPSDLPNGEMEEYITLTLKAYSDNYVTLKWTYPLDVIVHWIDSTNPAFTLDELDNFDDGTVQYWTATAELNEEALTAGVASDYVLSGFYSYKVMTSNYPESRVRVSKSFLTSNKDKVYAIIDFRMYHHPNATMHIKYIAIDRDNTRLLFIGKPYDGSSTDYLPLNKWLRVVVPLPKNTVVNLKIIIDCHNTDVYNTLKFSWWMDDFKIVSK